MAAPPLRNGKLNWVENPGLNRTYYDYDPALGGELGGVTHVWGAAGQPIKVEYDAVYGQVSKLNTFQAGTGWDQASWPSVPGPADVTEWEYDADTGLVNKKIYADSRVVSLEYTPDGRIASRFWARHCNLLPVETQYSYDANTTALTLIDYKGDEATRTAPGESDNSTATSTADCPSTAVRQNARQVCSSKCGRALSSARLSNSASTGRSAAGFSSSGSGSASCEICICASVPPMPLGAGRRK